MFFDYLFYRLAKFFYRRDGAFASRAVITVSTVQFMLPSAIMLFIQKSLYGRDTTSKYSKVEAICFTSVLVFVVGLNFFKYRDKYRVFREKWKDETGSQKRIRGVGIVFLVLASWASLILLGIT